MGRKEAIYDENITEEEEEKSRKPYIDYSFNNIKKVLNIIRENTETEVMVHADFNNFNICAQFNGATNSDFLLNRLNNVMTNEEKKMLFGYCNNENLLEIIYGSITCDYSIIYKDFEEYKKNVVGANLLIQFPKEKLYLYIYDCRGGILVSDDDNKEQLKKICYATQKEDIKLINQYWFKTMLIGIFDYTEEQFNELYKKEAGEGNGKNNVEEE